TLDLAPFRLGCSQTCQRGLCLHVHPRVDSHQLSAACLRFTECVGGSLFRNLRTIHADHDWAVLVIWGDGIIITDHHDWAVRVRYDVSRYRTHDHARQPAHAAAAHDNHGDVM